MSAAAAAQEEERLHFEDFAVGDSWTLAPFSMSEEDIVEFGRRWDPQPFHSDPVAARDSSFGGLIASGIHTLAAVVRAQYDGLMSRVAAVAGVGFDGLRFRTPVRPGQTLQLTVTVVDVSPQRPDRDWGQVIFRLDVTNSDGEEVLHLNNRVMIWLRAHDAAPSAGS